MAIAGHRKWLGFALKGAVTAGLIWFVLRDQDLGQIAGRLGAASLWSIAGALLFLLGQSVLGARRWVAVMTLFEGVIRFRTALRFFFEGLFFNQALPSTIGGDAVRMYRVVKAGAPVGAGVNGVLLDRIAGLLGLVLIVGATQPWLYQRVDSPAARTAFAAVIVAGLGGVGLLVLLDWVPAGLRRWAVIRGVAQLSEGCRRMLLRWRVALPVLGLSLFGHLLMVTAVYVLGRDLGLVAGYLDYLILVPGVMLLAAAPISIAGWGVREGVMISALALIGVPAAEALGLSILFGLCMMAIGLAGGVLWFLNPDHTVEFVRDELG